jgi:Phage integrase family.
MRARYGSRLTKRPWIYWKGTKTWKKRCFRDSRISATTRK